MARSERQKLKILYLYHILLTQTDENHPLTVPQIIEALEREGISAERKSIYADIALLTDFGLEIMQRRSRPCGWFVAERPFQLAELKLLVDAVQASRFLTEKKSAQLILKLESLASTHQGKQLSRQIFVSGRVKTMNESIYYNVDALHTALASRLTVRFHYFDYDQRRERVFRHNRAWYRALPLGLIYNDSNYYLVAVDGETEELRHYRVDKMTDIGPASTPVSSALAPKKFHLATYAQQHFGMFSGLSCSVTLHCHSQMAGVIIDRFGRNISMVPQGEDTFSVALPVVLSPQFFGWLFGLGPQVTLVSPPQAVEAYTQHLQAVAQQYTPL